MARITSIGMPKKRFVASAAEEREAAPAEQAQAPTEGSEAGPSKSKRKGWGRDPEIASECDLCPWPRHACVLRAVAQLCVRRRWG